MRRRRLVRFVGIVAVAALPMLVGGSAAAQDSFAAAEAALAVCDFQKARNVIATLPLAPRRAALVAWFKQLYETEETAREHVAVARSLEAAGNFGGAVAKLQEARALGPCAQTVTAIDAGIASLTARLEGGSAPIDTAPEAALQACRFSEAAKLITALPAGQRREGLAARMARLLETERAARDLVNAARTFETNDNLAAAIGKLEEAKALRPCAQTIAAIDRGISALRARAGTVDAGAGTAVEAAFDACEFDQAAGLIRAMPAGPQREALVARSARLVETERAVRALMDEARALETRNDLGAAIEKLHEAVALGPCVRTVGDIEQAIRRLTLAATGGLNREIAREAESAVAQCDKVPGSVAVDVGRGYTCECPEGLTWNFDRTACTTAQAADEEYCARTRPGSVRLWDNQADRYECGCEEPFKWNANRTACVPAQVADQQYCAGRFPGTIARIDQKTGEQRCDCPGGQTWDTQQGSCVAAIADCTLYPGTVLGTDRAGRQSCVCPDGQTWDEQAGSCVGPQVADAQFCASQWPGMVPRPDPQTGRSECVCPEGQAWDAAQGACTAASADCSPYPGTVSSVDKKTGKLACTCPEGEVWDSNQFACAQQVAEQNYCGEVFPGSVVQLNPATNRAECGCPSGSSWNAEGSACTETAPRRAGASSTSGGPAPPPGP